MFNSTNRQEPLRRQVKAKPIDWNVDHFRQAQAESQPTPAPVQPLAPQQPAMTSAPVEPLQPQTVQPQDVYKRQVWEQITLIRKCEPGYFKRKSDRPIGPKTAENGAECAVFVKKAEKPLHSEGLSCRMDQKGRKILEPRF